MEWNFMDAMEYSKARKAHKGLIGRKKVNSAIFRPKSAVFGKIWEFSQFCQFLDILKN